MLDQREIRHGRAFVDMNPYLAIGIFRRGIFAANTAGDDFGEKDPQRGLNAGWILTGVNYGDRNIVVVNDTAARYGFFQGQTTAGQVLDFRLER